MRWPCKISTEDKYDDTRQDPQSQNIKRRMLRCAAHLMRLPLETPAYQALQEFICPITGYQKYALLEDLLVNPKLLGLAESTKIKEFRPNLGSQALKTSQMIEYSANL